MATPKRHADEVEVDEELVRRLLRAQFPAWADLSLEIVEPPGTDHTLFRVGDGMVARMPIVEYATRQAAKEAQWVPFLAPQLPLALPTPLAIGQPGEGYPFTWSVVSWIDGERGTPENVELATAAVDLAGFVKAMHACDASDGPRPGRGNAFRGASLRGFDAFVHEAVGRLDGAHDVADAVAVAEAAIAAPAWDRPGVWFHGDLPGNLIARDGRLVGVIDSGYGIGDPACDLMPGWTFFHGESRAAFFDEVGLDDATRLRARGWAVIPALMGLSYYRDVPHLHAQAVSALEKALAD